MTAAADSMNLLVKVLPLCFHEVSGLELNPGLGVPLLDQVETSVSPVTDLILGDFPWHFARLFRVHTTI